MGKKIYFANGLFSAADIMFNNYCWDRLIEAGIDPADIYMPQKNAAINDKSASATSLPIYEGDTERLKEADILIAVLDGVSIDAGVASEIGWVAGWNEMLDTADIWPMGVWDKKVIIGVYTDSRDFSKTMNDNKNNESLKAGLAESQYDYKNLYTVGCCKKYGTVVGSVDELIDTIVKYL